MEQKNKHRIGSVAIVLFVCFAVVCDIIGLIPFAKDFTATIFWVISGFVLWKKGLGLLNYKKLATIAISWASSMIPFIQELPIELTAGIVAIIIISRAEEKTGAKLLGEMGQSKMPKPLNQGGVRVPTGPNNPANIDGVRAPNGGLPPTV